MCKIKLPKKIQVFVWRIMHNILPVCVNLANRRIPINRTCFRCEIEKEDSYHALRDCIVAKEVWQKLGWEWDDNSSQGSSMQNWLHQLLEKLNLE